MNKISQYCQKCRAANKPGGMNCSKCGAPLMLVVYPPSIRHADTVTPSYYEDHLLERVSLLELRLVQMSETLMMAMDVIREQGQMIRDEHHIVKELFQTLEKLGIKKEKTTDETPSENNAKPGSETSKNKMQEILDAAETGNPEILERLVRQGLKCLRESDEKRAFDAFERACQNSSRNLPLILFYAEQLFLADKFDLARQKLEAAGKIFAHDKKIMYLLGAIYADEGENEKARQALSFEIENTEIAFALYFIRAMMAAGEENWLEAKIELIRALEIQNLPEIDYLIACVLFQIKDYEQALIYLKKTTAADKKFADAWFMQSIIYGTLDDQEAAKAAVRESFDAGESGAQCLEFFRGEKLPDLRYALPFQHFSKNKKRVLTGGSLRLRKFSRTIVVKTLHNLS